MNTYKVIGLMSGTSLDGVDIAYCIFELKDGVWSYSIEQAKTVDYPENALNLLHDVDCLSAFALTKLDVLLGQFYGSVVRRFVKLYTLTPDFVASHGHTIFHQPEQQITLQIGKGSEIAIQSGLTTINDFRSLDVANGGQGAPLVPIGDKLLFGNYEACINLGGISNISFDIDSKRVAFDICPINIVLNALSQKLGNSFDNSGELAKEGTLDDDLYAALNQLDFYFRPFPKSLGKEWIVDYFNPILSEFNHLTPQSLLRTCVEHMAFQISNEIKTYLPKGSKILFTGGGTFNSFLIERIKTLLNNEWEIVVPSPEIINFKEALIFAFLGVLRTRNEINTLKEVTGAESDSSGGVIWKI